jgi:hypothetical protein
LEFNATPHAKDKKGRTPAALAQEKLLILKNLDSGSDDDAWLINEYEKALTELRAAAKQPEAPDSGSILLESESFLMSDDEDSLDSTTDSE